MSSHHPELDQLSAYIDDELDASERDALATHLPTCAECRTTLDALKATVADLGTLPEAVPSEQDSWALRAAIARARAPVKRWHRAAWAAGAVAAAAIAVVAITQPGRHNEASLKAAAPLQEGAGQAGPAIQYDAGNFTAGSAQRKLLIVSGVATDRQVTNAPAPAGGAGLTGSYYGTANASPTSNGAEAQTLSRVREDASAAIDRCVRIIQRSTEVLLTPVEYDVGVFESKPAFLLFFRAPDRYELWVVDRTKSCNTLYFAQAG